MKELRLTEEERQFLEALFLKAELLQRDITEAIRRRDQVLEHLHTKIQELAEKQGLEAKGFRPEFVDYRLVKIIIIEDVSSSHLEQAS